MPAGRGARIEVGPLVAGGVGLLAGKQIRQALRLRRRLLGTGLGGTATRGPQRLMEVLLRVATGGVRARKVPRA